MNQQTPLSPPTSDCNGIEDFTHKIIGNSSFSSLRKRIAYGLLVFAFVAIAPTLLSPLFAQSSTCVPPVDNGNTDPWSEECYLNNSCGIQGNPCQAGDVAMLGVFIADEMGQPVPACNVGDEVEVLLWGTFNNSTNSARYAVRTRTEIFINGVFLVELIGCSFDVLAPGETNVALLGTFNYTCGDQVQLVNTWIAWDTNQAQCSNSGGANYDNVCGEYPPSKCSRDFDTINFLTPNFEYFCGLITSTTTEVCFNDLTIGGVPPYTYLWEFGDNTTSTLENPCHTYVGTTGTYTVTLTVVDDDGIQAGAILEVDLDSLDCCDMTVICPPVDGGLFSCVEDIPAGDTDLITVTDSCGPIVITFEDDTTGTGCGTDTMFVVRSYFITDGSNLDTCVQTFAAVDDVGPVLIGCPGDISVECANLVPVQDLDGIDATDNCSGGIFLSLLPDVISDSTCANRYVITRTYVATDLCGNSTTCEQLITVFDDTNPVFTFVPVDSFILCDATQVFGVPVVTDNCGGVVELDSVTNTFPTVTCAGGSVVRVWTATDACGNTSTADQALFLIDTIDPEFIFEPADTSIACDETAVFGTPVVTDNCDVSVSVDSIVTTAPTVNCAGGTTTIVWTATDDCGNTATANQVITFIDTLDPVFTFVPNDTMIACDVDPVFGIPIATDNCDLLVAITADTVTLEGVCSDTITVTWTATDNCGNTSTADQIIYQVDILAPSITCPPDVTLECGASTEPNTSIPGEATATDNCDVTPTVGFTDVTVASQTCVLEYTITRTWTATDDCGNSTACVQTITIDDSLPPTLRCPIDITIECTDAIIPDSTGTPVVSDICDSSPEVSFTDVTLEGVCPQSYLIERTWLAVDTCGNDTTCVQLITVTDSTGPVIVCPADTIVDCTAAVDTAALGVATATDNCGGTVDITFTDAIVPGGCEQEYTINRTWLAVDECLNRTTCLQVISVQDTVPPVFDTLLCPTVFDFYTSEGSTCPAESPASIFLNAALGIPLEVDETWTVGNNLLPSFEGCLTDNCADPDSFNIIVSSISFGGDSCDFSVFVTFFIEDNCGNGGINVDFTVNIHDDVAPVITCPLNTTIDCDDSTSPDSTGYATAIDECIGLVGITFEDSTAAGTCPNEMLIFRTWTADDSCGNTSTCTQLIFVVDDTAPVMTCPMGVTVECTDSISPDSTGFPTVVDNCDLTPEVTFVDATIASQTCPLEYTIIRSWTAIDTCGNISTCVQNIFVDDRTAPELTCPDNITVECDDSTDPDSTGIATAIDNCDLSPEVSFLDATIEGACPQAFGIIRVWTAIDTCGNISTCTQLITVVDTTAPVITCPVDVTLDCTALTLPNSTVPGSATATDNCDTAPLVTSSDVTAAGSCPQEYTITRTWIATDACLNTSTCAQNITIQDTLAPVISCPADTIIDCTSGTLPGFTGRATAVDNCQLSVTPTFDDVTVAGDCAQEYTITRTWTAIDSCLNVSTCVQTISVQDTLGPVLVCPPDTVIDCTENILPDNTGLATATDNCDTLVTPTFEDVTMEGLCPQGYTIQRTWTAIDDCLNSTTCIQIISVQDTLDPVLTCPADTIIDCTEDIAALNLGVAIATDNCDTSVLVNSVDVIVPSTVCPTGYTILRTWTAVDDCLNRTTCLQTITVQDTTAPVIVCPADTVIDCNTIISPDVLGTATATDNCDATVTPTFADVTLEGSCPQEYTITRIWTATDSCFNSSTCVQIITIQDTISPVITCPADTIIDCTADTSPDSNGSATATDNCDTEVVPTFEDVTIAGDCEGEYTINRTWTAIDDCLNESTCLQIISVQDTTAPVIVCPADTIIDCTSGTLPGITGRASATDNCDTSLEPTFDDVTVAGECAQEYTINRTWTVIDDCLNESTCLQIISVQDTTGPVIICPSDTIVDCSANTDPSNLGAATATDNCDTLVVPTFTDLILPLQCPHNYLLLRTWTAVDDCENSSVCIQPIFVQDTTAPVIVCPADTVIDCTSLISPDLLGAATATDNCSDVVTPTFDDVTIAGQCPQEYTIIRTWTAVDSCFNVSTCGQTITVQDTLAPVITCPADTIINCGTSISTEALGFATAIDNCGDAPVVTSSDLTMQGECPQEMTIIRTWLAVDECQNVSTCIQTIMVQDTTPPVIVCPADTVVNCGTSISPDVLGSATATDNCDLAPDIISVDVTLAGECPQEYTITRTWTAIDECLNVSTCVQIISVQDTSAPVLLCPPNFTVECNESTEPDSTGFPFVVFENCDPSPEVTYSDVTLAGFCPNEYTITRTWTATDSCGNSSTCNQFIIVDDSTPPVITCPENLTIDCTASTLPDSTGFATAIDNCDETPEVTYSDLTIASESCPQEYTIIRVWQAFDTCSNGANCTQTIFVQDTTRPVAVFIPPDITVECDTNIQVLLAELPIFEDNCDTLVPAFGSIEILQNPDCPYTNTYIIGWSGVDDCGNSTTVGRTIVVIDTTGPVIVCPEDVTLDCLDDTSTESNGFAEATDNCDPEPIITSADVTIEGECPQEYTIERTWTASDACGNSSTCVQTLTVVDTMPPLIVCPADLTFECRNQVPPPSIEGITASDSCGATTVTFVADIITDSTCVNRLNINRVYQAEDECGNTSTCTQVINVFDDTPPVLLCPANLTFQCASEVPAPNTLLLIASDNCGGQVSVAHIVDVTTSMTCANRFIVTRTYGATDACGTTTTCNQIITVFDNTPPMITCPANLTFQCASQVPAPNIAQVTVTDNCAGTSTVVHVGDVITNMTCVNRFTLTRTYRATDACGNSATCAQTIIVNDNTAPMITCPAPVTVQCAAQVPPPNTALVTASDNCGGTVNVTHVGDVITNMTCVNRFTLTRTYRATDACNNSATCTQVITVFDNTAPTITFNDPLLEGIPNGGTIEVQCFGQDPNWTIPTFGPGDVTTMDNCAGNVTVVLTDDLIDEGDCDVDGYINRYRFIWTATDACGNSSTAHIFMELIDTIPPVIQGVPENITVNCDEIPLPPTNVMATDECLCACIVEFEESVPLPGCQNGQVITRTWTAEDDCGNVAVEVQTITLIDVEGPEIVVVFPELEGVEDGTVFEYTCNEGGIPEFFDELNAESVVTVFSCGTAGIVTFDPTVDIANNCKFWGYIEQRTYVWEAVDQCGNISTFTIIVRLIDTEGPQFINIPEMTCVDDPALSEVDIVDNCENAKFTYWDTKIPNPCGEGDALRRTYEAWDDCGNYSRDTVILIPNDKIHPTMEFINPDLIDIGFGEVLIVECNIGENGQYTPYGPDDVQVMDACMGEITVTYTERIIESGDCNDGVVAVMELVWMAMDVCGNRSQLLINAHLVDNTRPELINFEVDVTIDCNDDMPELFAVDNCGEVTITTVDSIIPGACEFEYDVLRRITVSDPCGNTTERLQIVRVGDGQGPVIEGVDEEICDDLSIPEVTAFDPCAGTFVGVTMEEDTLDVPCRDGFVLERIWTAVDACGNVSEVRQIIIIGDQTAPEILIPSGSVIRLFDFFGPNLLDLSQDKIFARLEALGEKSIQIKDDCDQEIIPEFSLDVTISDDCQEDGYYEHRVYTWIATDACGNSATFSFEVDIMDDIPPVLSGTPEDTVVVCEGLPAPPVVLAEDYADDVILEYEELIIPGDGPGVFVVIRTWTATDPCGNVSQASQNITWIPETLIACDILLPETVDCNTHGVVIGSDVSGGLGGVTYMWEITGEKCFIQSGQNTPEITIYVGFSEVEISLTVTDAFGCSNVCTATLDCLDPIVADFTAQQDPTTPVVIEGPAVQGSNDMLGVLQHFNMWPNPAAASVNISFESLIEHNTRIVLVNYLGQTVYSKEMKAIKGFNSHKLNVAHLPEGSYMVQLMSERAVESKMLVLVRNK